VVFVMECQIPYDTLHEFAWSCPVLTRRDERC
jgi:hypothetical protein